MRDAKKDAFRMAYRKKRDAMPVSLVESLSARICRSILEWGAFQKAEAVFFYYPLGKEVSLLAAVTEALAQGKRTAFPKTAGNSMQFYEITDLKEFSEGRFHVMEPFTEGKNPVRWEPQLCFVPGTVFDRAGGRMGYGKGYYDRYFAGNRNVLLAGCAYEFQIADSLVLDAWDIRMDWLVTENGMEYGKEYKCYKGCEWKTDCGNK